MLLTRRRGSICQPRPLAGPGPECVLTPQHHPSPASPHPALLPTTHPPPTSPQIMKGDVAEVPAIINSKTGATSTESREVASMRAVAEAYDSRSLHDFQAVLEVSTGWLGMGEDLPYRKGGGGVSEEPPDP